MIDFNGKTALVTGASAGIGREIARLLAREVGTLVLVARRQDRLDDLASELTGPNPSLRVLVRAVDLNDRAASAKVLDDLDRDGVAIDILINNAGFGGYGFFEDQEWSKIEAMLELNMVSATFLLHRLLPPMVRRGSGAILNVGSVAGMVPNPMMATYGATKSYLNFLSEGIRAELAGTGVVVTALCPGPVPTEFQEVAGSTDHNTLPEFLIMTAVECAVQGLEGLRRGHARVIPGPVRALMIPAELLPKPLIRPIIALIGHKIRRPVKSPKIH